MPLAVVVLLIALVVAAWTDCRRRLIPNSVVYPALAVCLIVSVWQAGLDGFIDSTTGLIVCGGLGFLGWRCDAVGGGDVKLAALIGVAFGWADGLHVLLWSSMFVAVLMTSRVLWSKGLRGIPRSDRRQLDTAPDDLSAPPLTHPIYLAPAALAAVIVTWPVWP